MAKRDKFSAKGVFYMLFPHSLIFSLSSEWLICWSNHLSGCHLTTSVQDGSGVLYMNICDLLEIMSMIVCVFCSSCILGFAVYLILLACKISGNLQVFILLSMFMQRFWRTMVSLAFLPLWYFMVYQVFLIIYFLKQPYEW